MSLVYLTLILPKNGCLISPQGLGDFMGWFWTHKIYYYSKDLDQVLSIIRCFFLQKTMFLLLTLSKSLKNYLLQRFKRKRETSFSISNSILVHLFLSYLNFEVKNSQILGHVEICSTTKYLIFFSDSLFLVTSIMCNKCSFVFIWVGLR